MCVRELFNVCCHVSGFVVLLPTRLSADRRGGQRAVVGRDGEQQAMVCVHVCGRRGGGCAVGMWHTVHT
jgi:hypothetical protein